MRILYKSYAVQVTAYVYLKIYIQYSKSVTKFNKFKILKRPMDMCLFEIIININNTPYLNKRHIETTDSRFLIYRE